MIADMLLSRNLSPDKICKSTPTYLTDNREFIVDTTNLTHWKDFRTDMHSGLVRTGTKKHFFSYDIVAGKNELEKVNPSNGYKYEVRRNLYTHKNENSFHKVIIRTWKRFESEPLPLMYVQYYFEGEQKIISFNHSHGNSREKNPSKKTNFSTRELVKELAMSGKKGKEIFKEVVSAAGGFEGANSWASIPSSYTQIYDLTRKNKGKSSDEIIELLDMCNQQKALPIAFVREVLYSPELNVVLASDRQLKDIEMFCTNTVPYSVLGVDPTFNITNHNVTVTTYRHPLLEVESSGVSPVIIGPVLIHDAKTFESYYTLPSTMVKLRPGLSSLKAFGTDGKENLSRALKICFPQADNLLCWIHVRDNIQRKLSSLGEKETERYMVEIFGKKSGSIKIKGLLDVNSPEEFELKWKKLENEWSNRESVGVSFLEYMVRYTKESMKTKMTTYTRTRSGLGTPPSEYNQNGNESINRMIKAVKQKNKLIH